MHCGNVLIRPKTYEVDASDLMPYHRYDKLLRPGSEIPLQRRIEYG